MKAKPTNEIELSPSVTDFVERIEKIRKDNPKFTLKQALTFDKLDNVGKYPWEFECKMSPTESLKDVIKAWESLEGGSYSPKMIQLWLVDEMKPAIDRARKVIEKCDQ